MNGFYIRLIVSLAFFAGKNSRNIWVNITAEGKCLYGTMGGTGVYDVANILGILIVNKK